MWEDLLRVAKKYEDNNLFWEAEESYKKALLEFNKIKWYTEEKSLCKKKIREMNVKKSDSFQSHIFQYEFSEIQKTETEKFVKYIVEADNSFDLIGNHPFFFPSFSELQKRAKESLPISFQFIDLSVQDDDWNLIKWWNNPELSWFYQQYNISQGFILQGYLVPIFHELIGSWKFDSNSIITYFKEKNIFTNDFISILEVAIERFLNNDFISCLHILIPKLEKVIIDLTTVLSKDWVDTITSRKQNGEDRKIWTQDKTLSEDFLRDEKILELWWKDLCEQIIFVFFSQLWYRLRHKIAHWYSTLSDLSFQNCCLVIYFYIVIISRIKTYNV